MTEVQLREFPVSYEFWTPEGTVRVEVDRRQPCDGDVIAGPMLTRVSATLNGAPIDKERAEELVSAKLTADAADGSVITVRW